MTERSCAAPISGYNVDSHISDGCSHHTGYLFVAPRTHLCPEIYVMAIEVNLAKTHQMADENLNDVTRGAL